MKHYKEHKMEKTTTQFGDTDVQKHQFHQYKKYISRENIDIYEIVVSNKVSFDKKGFKHFIGCIFVPKISAHRRDFYETKYMSFLIKDDKLLENNNEIWEKVKNSINKEFDNGFAYN